MRITWTFRKSASSVNPPAIMIASKAVRGCSQGMEPAVRTEPSTVMVLVELLSREIKTSLFLSWELYFVSNCFWKVANVTPEAVISPMMGRVMRPSGRMRWDWLRSGAPGNSSRMTSPGTRIVGSLDVAALVGWSGKPVVEGVPQPAPRKRRAEAKRTDGSRRMAFLQKEDVMCNV